MEEPDAVAVIPPRPVRPRPAAASRRPVRAVVRWAAGVAVLLLAGAAAVGLGWSELADDRARAACITRTVEEAEAFTAVLGDPRAVPPASVERSCDDRS